MGIINSRLNSTTVDDQDIEDAIENAYKKIDSETKNNRMNHSETVNKMLENLSDEHPYIHKVNLNDKNKLFLNNFKENIEEIDNYAKKHFTK